MAPIKNTKSGFYSLFADKLETHSVTDVIDETHSTTEVFEPGNGYRYLIYTSPGSLTVNRSGKVDLLLIGGGGAGGNGEFYPPNANYAGGGGGAGGVYESFLFTFPVGDYTISVGDGGAISPTPTGGLPGTNRNGSPGSPTDISGPTITTITAYGGGGGGGSYDYPSKPAGDAGDGGSGGGTSFNSSGAGVGNRTTSIAPADGSPIPSYLQGEGKPQGSPGIRSGVTFTGGGGGGAGASGAPTYYGGVGRSVWTNDDGIPPSYGTPGPTPGRWFAGGGGGGVNAAPVQTGGAGGGGRGADNAPPITQTSTAGTVNTGGGGGGGYGYGNASPGGSGIVIIRYRVAET